MAKSILKRLPAKKRPRKAKSNTRGATAAETLLPELTGEVLAVKAAIERAGGIVTGQYLDPLGGNPFLTPRETERRLGVAYNTVMRAIVVLEAGGVLAKVGDGRLDRVFCARAILDFLDEPARLVPEPPSTHDRKSRG